MRARHLRCGDRRVGIPLRRRCGASGSSPWRIIVAGEIRLGWRDHGQRFGLPSPVDGVSEATKLLGGSEVDSAQVSAETADLVISFGSACRFEAFNGSSGYEGWTLNAPGGELFVAQGGGRLVKFKP